MINISALTEHDKGRKVRYTSTAGDKVEVGEITSWNKQFVFVRYFEQLHPERRLRLGETSEATHPADLEWE